MTSSSPIALTLGSGTLHFPWIVCQYHTKIVLRHQQTAFSLRFCLIVLLRALARASSARSMRYAGIAPSGTLGAVSFLLFFSSCILRVFLSWTFSWKRCLEYSLALNGVNQLIRDNNDSKPDILDASQLLCVVRLLVDLSGRPLTPAGV